MEHPDAGVLRAWMDEPRTLPSEIAQHVAACRRCADAVAELRERTDKVARALETLDVPPATARAHEAIRKLVAADRDGVGRAPAPRALWPLARAAGLVLLLAGGVAAAVLPGSPLRSWVATHLPGGSVGPAAGPSAAEPTPRGPGEGETGIRVPAGGQALRIVVTGLEAGGSVAVRWTHGDHVWIIGPEGSRFRSAPGRAQAEVAGRSLRVEIPKTVAATLEVNGRMYLRTGPEGAEVLRSPDQEDAQGLLFRVSSR